jgi:hypothetical protein
MEKGAEGRKSYSIGIPGGVQANQKVPIFVVPVFVSDIV